MGDIAAYYDPILDIVQIVKVDRFANGKIFGSRDVKFYIGLEFDLCGRKYTEYGSDWISIDYSKK